MITTKIGCMTAFRNYTGVYDSPGFSDLDTTPNPSGYIPMLSTQVKDRNGKVVFERDIVEFDAEKYTDGELKSILLCDVIYDPECAGFCLKPVDGDKNTSFPMWKVSDSIAVIGNKYDNPELLKGGQDG